MAELFGGGKPAPAQDPSKDLNLMARRLRVIEEQATNLRRKIQVTEQNMLSIQKKNQNELRALGLEITEVRRVIEDLQNNLLLIIKELRLCSKKEDVAVLQRYVNMWEPINFVTRREVEKIISEKLDERKV